MFSLIVCLSYIFLVHAQICQRDVDPITDTLGQCLKSSDFDVENCCYQCPMLDPLGYYYTCNSLYDLGFGSCTQAGARDAMYAECVGNGGSPDGTDFSCSCNIGTNKSQTTDYVPISTNAPVDTPMNTGHIANALLSLSLFVLCLFI